MHRFLCVASLVGSLPVAHFGCAYPAQVVVAPPRDRVVEHCHRAIRAQAADRIGGRAAVSFDTSETYYVSSSLEGVRGGGVIAAGRDRARIHYSCTVNVRSERVVQADHQLIAAPRRGPEWPVDACQDTIRDEVADRSRHSTVRFDTVETYFISLDREGVRGMGRVKTGDRREGIKYECTVDIRRGQVTRARYRPIEKPPLTNADAVQLCQREIAEKAGADRGRQTKVSFDEGEAHVVSRSERGVRGEAKLRTGGDKERIAYECTVDVRRRSVTAAHYRPLEKPPPPSERIIKVCQMVTRQIAAADYGRPVAVEFETAETFSLSNRRTGVRGPNGGSVPRGAAGSRDVGSRRPRVARLRDIRNLLHLQCQGRRARRRRDPVRPPRSRSDPL
jgi:hypothetical protein